MQKVDKKKKRKKKGEKFQKRAIHRTPKQIKHDYDSSVRAHWTGQAVSVTEACSGTRDPTGEAGEHRVFRNLPELLPREVRS